MWNQLHYEDVERKIYLFQQNLRRTNDCKVLNSQVGVTSDFLIKSYMMDEDPQYLCVCVCVRMSILNLEAFA